MILLGCFSCVYSQGWYAEVDVDLNHELYAYESISKVTVTYSGVTVTGSSPHSQTSFILTGLTAISGDLTVSANGQAWEPYDPSTPYSEPLVVQFSGKHTTLCTTGFFEQHGVDPHQQLYIWIRVYPRMEISSFVQLCDNITLSTNTCSPSYTWEVSDSPGTNFKTLAGKSGATIVITQSELMTLGFSDPYGRKYFRVTGKANTTSQLQAVDIYYPGPTATITTVAPKCHNGVDGSVSVDIVSAYPAAIDDFVVTLFGSVPPEKPISQDAISNTFHKTFSALSAGDYWVRIENNSNKDLYGNCWTDYSAGTLVNPEAVTLRATASDHNGFGVSCAGTSDGTIQVMANGGTGQYAVYEWSPAVSTNALANNLSAGTYGVRVKDSFGCWSATMMQEITEPEKLAIELVSTGGKNGYDVSCFDKSDGAIEAEVSGGVPVYTYLWSQSATTSFLSGLAPGHYSVSATDANGCTVSKGLSLQAPDAIVFDITEIKGVRCPGDQSGALEITTPANTIGAISVLWSSGEQTQAISGKGPGTYVATVSDDQGCSGSATHVLEEPLPHTAEILILSDYNGSPIRCNGTATGSVAAILRDGEGREVLSGYYSWFRNGDLYKSGNGLSTLTDMSAGEYRAEIEYNTSCKTEASVALAEPKAVEVSTEIISDYNGKNISCAGHADGHLRANASGGTGILSYEWNNNAVGPEVEGVPADIYGVVVTDVNGCEAHAETILKEPEILEGIAKIISDFHGQPLSCFDASDATLQGSATGGTSPYTFEWSTGQTSEYLRNVPAGSYALRTTDANGCISNAEAAVSGPSQLSVSVSQQSDYTGYGTSCFGSRDGSLLAEGSGGTGKYLFTWLPNGATTPNLTSLAAGQYNVTVSDENGCTAEADFLITEPEPLSLRVLQAKNVSCAAGDDGAVDLLAEGGVSAFSYSVSAKNPQAEPTFTGLKSGVHNFRVADANGCIATTSHDLTEPAPITIDFTDVSAALCGSAEGKASAVAAGGTGKYLYVWKTTAGEILSQTKDLFGVVAGIYQVTVTDEHSCQKTSSVGVTSTEGPRASIAEVTGTTCSYTQDGKARIEILEGDGPFVVEWEDGQESLEAEALAPGRQHVKVTDVNNCSIVETIHIPAADSLQINILKRIDPRCSAACDGEIEVSAEGGTGEYTYSWDNASGPSISSLCDGDYTVKVLDSNNCTASTLIALTEPPPIEISMHIRRPPRCPETCDGELQVEASGGTGTLEFSWSDGSAGATAQNLCSGTFAVVVKDAHQCYAEESFTLIPPDVQQLEIGESVTLCEGQTHTIDAGPGWREFHWTADNGFESTSRMVTLSDDASYFLNATDFNGCVARDTFLLQTSTELLHATFLLASEAVVGDTVVAIDISWPIPDSVEWTLPEGFRVVQASGDLLVGSFEKQGIFEVTMSAALGQCKDALTKIIEIIQPDTTTAHDGRLVQEVFIEDFDLYPNPNDGNFYVIVSLREEAPILLTVWNVLTSRKIAQIKQTGRSYYHEHIDLAPLSAGSYSLRLNVGHETKYIRFIVR